MKIGLLTLPVETGYGSILQAVALKHQLQLRGHEVVLIRRHGKRRDSLKRILGRTVKKYLLGKDVIIRLSKKERDEFPIITQYTQPFIDKYLQPYTKMYYSTWSMRQINNLGFDAIVVGSDQVWRPRYMQNVADFFLYEVNDSISKYAYAASLGTEDWRFSEKETMICGEAVRKFKAVSVRESSSVELCEKHFHIKPTFVLDPTLLCDSSFYSSFIDDHKFEREGKLCAYVLDHDDMMGMVNKYANLLSTEPVFPHGKVEDKTAPVNERIVKPVSTWLDCIKSSVAVITDSFHGMVFSIIFHRPFVVSINHQEGSARFLSLLKLLHLEHRIVNPDTDFTALQPIDWDEVDSILNKMRKISNDFLDGIK